MSALVVVSCCNLQIWNKGASVGRIFSTSREGEFLVFGGLDFVDHRETSGEFSTNQPMGSIHLGNYLGAIKSWVAMQDLYETLFLVVDLHAITIPHDVERLTKATRTSAALHSACGIDPTKASIFVQSHVPELTWLLSCVTPISWLNKMLQYVTLS